MKLSFLLGLVGSLAITACGSDKGEESGEKPVNPPVVTEKYVTFTPSINAPARATDTSFDQGDAIGIFAVQSTGNDKKGIIAEKGNYADNVKYLYSGTKFAPAKDGIVKPSDDVKVYYHAVYPYTTNAKNKFTFKVDGNQSTSSGYTNSDFLTAQTSATNDASVPLKFDHRLSKMIINMEGTGWPSGDLKVTLKDVYTSIAVDLNTLTFTPTGSKGTVVCSSNGTKSFKAILPPQTITKGTEIATITIGSENYTVVMSGDAEIGSGVQSDFTFTMNENKEIVQFTGDINPWDTPERINQVVPSYIQAKMKDYITIYSGNTPPNVEGGYLISKNVAVYCEDIASAPGTIVADTYIRFSNQNASNNTLDYDEKSQELVSTGKGAFISGTGNNFTAFFNTVGMTHGISTKTALVISGTKTSTGIKDLHYAFIMIEKGSDPNGKLMKEGVFRVFKDQDGMAENSNWSRSVDNRSCEKETGFNMMSSKWQ